MNRQNILITGVSSGIGLAMAERLLNNGYFVFGSVRQEKDAERLKKKLGSNFHPVIMDVTDYPSIEAAKEAVIQNAHGNGLTALINNSGIVVSGPLKYLSMEDLEYQFRVNVFGLVKVTQIFLPLLGGEKNTIYKPGTIINVSSISGLFTLPFIVPYSTSKHALESITDGLRRELDIYGINVVSVNPGAVRTPIWEKVKASRNVFAGTDYAGFEGYSQRQIELNEKDAIEPDIIAKTIQNIIEKKARKPSYLLMKNALVFKFMLALPKSLQDKIINQMKYGTK
ncbi:MAG: SDR family oxidoreductase [Anaerolineales bacterium]|nr:SDR family oxidoreductase [Anaerolineales bacterium]